MDVYIAARVKFFNVEKGFGFAETEDGTTYYAHVRGITTPVRRANGSLTYVPIDRKIEKDELDFLTTVGTRVIILADAYTERGKKATKWTLTRWLDECEPIYVVSEITEEKDVRQDTANKVWVTTVTLQATPVFIGNKEEATRLHKQAPSRFMLQKFVNGVACTIA